MMSGRATVICGECREVMGGMDAGSINTCVTSPPYWGLRDYGTDPVQWPEVSFSPMPGLPEITIPAMECSLGLEKDPWAYIGHLVLIFRGVNRVLRDDGTLWLNLGDTYAGYWGKNYAHKPFGKDRTPDETTLPHKESLDFKNSPIKPKDLCGIPWRVAFALQADGWYLRQDIIWAKPNPMPESVTDRCTKAHEYIFLLSKNKKYYYDHKAIREESVEPVRKREKGNGESAVDTKKRGFNCNCGNSGMRNKRDVWTITTKPFKAAHFATFPPDLIKPCVLAGCPEGGTVLDIFGGAATTGIVAIENNRNAVLIELNPAYVQIANTRITGAYL